MVEEPLIYVFGSELGNDIFLTVIVMVSHEREDDIKETSAPTIKKIDQ